MDRVFNFLGSSGFCPALRRLGRRRRGLQNVRVRSLKTKFRKNVRKSLDLISSLIFASTCSIIYNGSHAREAQANCRKGAQVLTRSRDLRCHVYLLRFTHQHFAARKQNNTRKNSASFLLTNDVFLTYNQLRMQKHGIFALFQRSQIISGNRKNQGPVDSVL